MLVLGIKQIKTVILSKSSKPNAGNIQLYWPGLGCVPGNPQAGYRVKACRPNQITAHPYCEKGYLKIQAAFALQTSAAV